MVVSVSHQELLHESSKHSCFSLPSFKAPVLKLSYDDSEVAEAKYDNGALVLPFSQSELLSTKVSSWSRLTAVSDKCKPVYEVTFHLQDNKLQFKPGDTIGILPQNPKLDVDFIINSLNLKPKADLTYKLSCEGVKGAKIPPHIPTSSTIQYVLTHCVDLRTILKKLFLLTLSKYTEDSNERQVLKYLSSKEGSHAYTHYVLERNMCILDILKTYKSCKPSIEVLFASLPRLLPRPYSIINSSLTSNKEIKICFSVMNLGNNRKGLTTSYLEDILLNKESIESHMNGLSISDSKENDTVKIYLRKNMNGFLLPDNVNTPLLLIGPGTGVAPFVGFLEERAAFKVNNPEVEMGAAWLIFGCRNPKLDYLYEKELNQFLETKVLYKLGTVFSRAEDNNDLKYVQDYIRSNKKEIAEYIQSGASIYVCGDLKSMAVEVKKAIKESVVEYLNKSEEDADLFLTSMEKDKKYLTDIWS